MKNGVCVFLCVFVNIVDLSKRKCDDDACDNI